MVYISIFLLSVVYNKSYIFTKKHANIRINKKYLIWR